MLYLHPELKAIDEQTNDEIVHLDGLRESASPQSHVEKEAEACFLKAIDIARVQQARSFEFRAATSLARLWQQQGKQVEIHKLLSEIYHWFTEGFNTKDLQEAKALLKELA